MPPRACPFCHRAMQVLLHGRIELDRCLDCEATWFDRDELAPLAGASGAPALTRDQPVGRCPGCGGLLWSARVEGCELLACITCAGCIVSDNQLRRVREGRRLQPGTPRLQFVCVGCKDRYAFEKAERVTTGLACAHCAADLPRWAPPAPRVEPHAEGAPPASSSGGVFTSVVDILLDLLTFP
ncbi:zf-TFIIB domain-containing protein [Pyxidicoccus parkwayensis]|uniref:Zf-TFIIB domain-containing protein n=1 Tax=Pyxidicoccus parkwayensis TaxID=2813578 RepID=A0ABX7NNR8_9BACT|nr:zf-TFIIB domain-containing protein [Pyxidicoccus parkwaysis]QSQ19114.1 zf-TFIIB domain-containing protein [Pyxidicoccus parkwaysis]